jgi:hypothetical protein
VRALQRACEEAWNCSEVHLCVWCLDLVGSRSWSHPLGPLRPSPRRPPRPPLAAPPPPSPGPSFPSPPTLPSPPPPTPGPSFPTGPPLGTHYGCPMRPNPTPYTQMDFYDAQFHALSQALCDARTPSLLVPIFVFLRLKLKRCSSAALCSGCAAFVAFVTHERAYIYI